MDVIEVNEDEIYVLSRCLNCRRMILPFKYLRLIIGGNLRRALYWKLIMVKIKNRLSK